MNRRELAQLIILLIGISLLLSAFLIGSTSDSMAGININTVFLSIGCSVLAVVIINFFEFQVTAPERQTVKNISEWGLIAIYETRAEMNQVTNKLLEKANEIDLSVFGAKGLLNFNGELLKDRLRKGASIRFLVPDKDSGFIVQREMDEGVTPGEIRKSMNDLYSWVRDAKEELTDINENQLSIKVYDSLPIDSIMRVDGDLFVGPFMVKKISQLTMSYQYKRGGMGFDYYLKYFNEVWKYGREVRA